MIYLSVYHIISYLSHFLLFTFSLSVQYLILYGRESPSLVSIYSKLGPGMLYYIRHSYTKVKMAKTKTYFEKYFFVLTFSNDSSSELSFNVKSSFLSLFKPLFLSQTCLSQVFGLRIGLRKTTRGTGLLTCLLTGLLCMLLILDVIGAELANDGFA